MPDSVVDASVLASWCFREPRQDEALELIRDESLYAPIMLRYELTNIAARKSQTYPGSLEIFTEQLLTALSLPIKIREVDHTAVLQLAVNTDLTAYDASYLFLARTLNIPLLTFDRQLARAATS